jgi:sugar/nucleoside kinase (ribokinase family)
LYISARRKALFCALSGRAPPAGVKLDAIWTSARAPLPVSVILNPARECRILRQVGDADARDWKIAKVPKGARAAGLHVVGRLPQPFVAALVKHAHARGARVAWVGGHALGPALERSLDLICVNAREAGRIVGRDDTPRALASAMALRASVDGAIRVVTGAGASPTSVAVREGKTVRVIEAAPPPVKRIATLLGVGDAFAAAFVAEAFDGELSRALAVAQRAAGRFLAKGRG